MTMINSTEFSNDSYLLNVEMAKITAGINYALEKFSLQPGPT